MASAGAGADLIGLVAVAGFFGVLMVSVIGGLLIAALKVLRGGASRKSRQTEAEEARLMQEINAGLMRMEQRVEALETLLLDSHKESKPSS